MNLCDVILVVMIITLEQVASQVCNETISVLREVPETYQYTFFEAYEASDCYLRSWCTKSRRAVNIGTRLIEKIVNETVNVCCEGYIEDGDSNGITLTCTPLCDPPCHNGFCKKPNECACEVGYAIDPYELQNQCVPLCLEGCNTPYCFSTCSQDDSEADTDLCFGTCLNGTCVPPGICHCDPGFKRVSDSCEPICPSCDHGRCIAPGHCKCDPGWYNIHGTCSPVCTGCEHGTCLAPGQCECHPGYKAQNGKCELHCLDCINGNCVGPSVCVCKTGWYRNEANTECFPHCDIACGNGTCVAYNQCECDTGYRVEEPQNKDSEVPLCVPECFNCEGVCIAPGVCKCDAQYGTVHTTADGSECCFDCADSNKKIDRIVCKKYPDESLIDNSSGINESELFIKTRTPVEEVISTIVSNDTIIGNNDVKTNNTIMSCVQMADQHAIIHWIYAGIIIVEFIVFILILSAMKRTKIFFPQGKSNEAAVYYNTGIAKLKETKPESP